MILSRLSVSTRFILVLIIGFVFQAGISAVSLLTLRDALIDARTHEVKHLLETAFSTVKFYHDQAEKGLLTDEAARQAARDAVRAMHYDNNNYYFIWTLEGTGVAHGSHPEWEGQNFISGPAAQSNPVVSYMVARQLEVAGSPEKEGVTTFKISKFGGNVPLDKVSYSRLFEPWGWVVGTGAYIEDIDAFFRSKALALLAINLCLVIFSSLVTFLVGRNLSRGLSRLTGWIARNDLAGSVPETARPDEVGLMARAFSAMAEAVNRNTAELEVARDTADAANSAKSNFLSSMSHELRTPLHAILGFSQVMTLKSHLTGDDQTMLGEIRRAGEHLLQLVNGLLDLSKIEAGHLDITIEVIALRGIIGESVTMVGPIAAEKGIRLSAPPPERITALVRADPIRLRQILINLLSNAIKYNRDDGEVILTCEAAPDSSFVRISVADTGVGISPEMQARLFTPFDRLGRENLSVGGTGIGLVIAKTIAAAMGGNLGFRSTQGQGSVFWVDIPVVSAQEVPKTSSAARMDAPPTIEPPSDHQQIIIYIDDDPVSVRLIQSILKHRPDIKLYDAPNAQIGMDLVRAHQPALVLMDINLPGMDGFAALKTFRSDPKTGHIPIVAVSADVMKGQVEKGLSAGFDDYLAKPFDIARLFEAISKVSPKS